MPGRTRTATPAPGPVSLAVSPTTANVLTCTAPTFTATVTAAVNLAIAFDANGVLWLTYRSNDGGPDRILVDKSLMSPGDAPCVVASATSALAVFTLTP